MGKVILPIPGERIIGIWYLVYQNHYKTYNNESQLENGMFHKKRGVAMTGQKIRK